MDLSKDKGEPAKPKKPEDPKEPEKPQKPEMPPDMAAWLFNKLDCQIPLDGHQDRNQFAACVNKLVEIAKWEEPKPE